MFFLLLVSVLFRRPLTFIILVGGIGGQGGIKMVSAKNNQLISSQRPHFSPCSTAITNDKSTNLRKNGIYWYKWCCDRFSILGENPYEEFDDENDLLLLLLLCMK